MPISEDEFEARSCAMERRITSTMSKAELRKTHKPIMEKRRRARINQCLNEIKVLILEAMKKDPSRHSKLEKADILEMAVKHLQNIQRRQLALGVAGGDTTVLRKFKTGFEECAKEISSYISRVGEQNATAGLRGRVDTHLTKCMDGIEQIASLNLTSRAAASSFGEFLRNDDVRLYEREGNMNRQPTPGAAIQLIPSRLPTGELAFLLPKSSTTTAMLNSPTPLVAASSMDKDLRKKSRNSAFATVIPAALTTSKSRLVLDKSPPSPPVSPNTATLLNINRNEDVDNISDCSERVDNKDHLAPIKGQHQYFRTVDTVLQKSYQRAFVSGARLGRYCGSTTDVVDPQNCVVNTSLAEDCRLQTITNLSERFKQAQVIRETVECEENRRLYSTRPAGAPPPGGNFELTAVTMNSRDLLHIAPSAKIQKTSSSRSGDHDDQNTDDDDAKNNSEIYRNSSNHPTCSGLCENIDHNNDMWRPW